MSNPPAIIFTTAYTDHALQAFETHAIDYLLKPIKRDRLANAISAAKRLTQAQIQRLRNDDMDDMRSKICVKSRGSLELVPIEEIIYFKADQKYVTLKTDDHEYLIEESLIALEQEFARHFVRIHRNALVSENHIAGLTKNESGHQCILLNDTDDALEISRRHLPIIRKKLKNLGN
jgi:two-component system response regulator AlgR